MKKLKKNEKMWGLSFMPFYKNKNTNPELLKKK